jgi:hypothetical protein
MRVPLPTGGADELARRLGGRIIGDADLVHGEWWLSGGVPERAVPTVGSVTRLPLLGSRTVWPDEPPTGALMVACPNRLGMFEAIPPWAGAVEVVWVTDALDWSRSPWREMEHAGVRPGPYAEDSATLTLDEATRRSAEVARALAARLASVPGCTVPPGPHGRRVPVIVEVDPGSVVARVPEASVPEPAVPGWPGCVLVDCDWTWSSSRPAEVATTIEQLVTAERARDRHRMSGVDQETP